jgi:hypothetical protein
MNGILILGRNYELFADMGGSFDPDNNARSVRKTKVKNVFTEVGQKMQFIFDYGDEWSFTIELTGYGEKIPHKQYPCMTDSFGPAPEQYPDWEEEDDGEEIVGINPGTGEIIPLS